jgi:cysteine-rich repeat protein
MRTHLLLLCPLCACLSQRTQAYLDGLDCTTGTDTSSDTGTSTSNDPSSSSDTTTTTTTTTVDPSTSTTTTDASSTTTVSTTTSETGTPMCGDGIVEDGFIPEECDDGNLVDDDGCSSTCARDLLAFVTSLEYQGGDLGSLSAGDAQCANRADDAGLPDPLKFKAWLSDSTMSARDRLVLGRGRIVLVNGLVFAAGWDAVLAGEIQSPLTVTEESETYEGGVWTGTLPDGAMAVGADHCEDWTNSSPVHLGFWGRSDETSASWTYSDIDNPIPCGVDYPIYCFQEP